MKRAFLVLKKSFWDEVKITDFLIMTGWNLIILFGLIIIPLMFNNPILGKSWLGNIGIEILYLPFLWKAIKNRHRKIANHVLERLTDGTPKKT